MERDNDLIRELLLEVEKQPYTGAGLRLELERHAPPKVQYHILLLNEAGMIEAQRIQSFGSIDELQPIRLTWDGHEFLEAIKQDERWGTVKHLMASAGGFVAGLAKELAISLMKKEVVLGP